MINPELRYFFKESTNSFIVSEEDPKNSVEITKDEFNTFSKAPEGKIRVIVTMEFVVDPLYEHNWAISELARADIQINLHLDNDDRASNTETLWREYRKALRNYTSTNDGIAVINLSARPTI